MQQPSTSNTFEKWSEFGNEIIYVIFVSLVKSTEAYYIKLIYHRNFFSKNEEFWKFLKVNNSILLFKPLTLKYLYYFNEFVPLQFQINNSKLLLWSLDNHENLLILKKNMRHSFPKPNIFLISNKFYEISSL